MPRFKKLYKKYERHFLLGIVIILLASFSITGAFSCQPRGPSQSYELGGSYMVAPGEREELDDDEFDRAIAKYVRFQRAIGFPSQEFLQFLGPLGQESERKAAWTHLVTLGASRNAGYDVGERQVRAAVEDLVGTALYYSGRMNFSDVNYQQYLRTNFDSGNQAEFEEGMAELVMKDQFLYPLIMTSRYKAPYAEAYEAWRTERERVDLEYVALPAAPFADDVRKDEQTRAAISEQADVLRQVVDAAGTLRRVNARVQGFYEAKKAWPVSLDELGTAAQPFRVQDDPWGQAVRYATSEGGAPDLRSAGPDGAFDTADDVTTGTQRHLDTYSGLYELAQKVGQRHTATGAWPKSLEALKSADAENKLPGLVRSIQDGWKRDITYTPGEGDAAPTLTSAGPDGEAGTADDITLPLVAGKVRVAPGKALAPYVQGDLRDSWGRPLRVRLARAQPPTWQVLSDGADGEEGTDDDLDTGNAQELERFFRSVQSDYVLPARNRFETLYVHLPLISDEALRSLWAKYPQHRPTDEEAVYNWWRSYRGENMFYRADDPRDPKTGHGAEFVTRIAPDATPTLVPDASIFPDPLGGAASKDDEPEKSDEPEKGDEPEKDDEPKKDDDTGPADAPDDAADRKAFRDKGWREIVIRERFLEDVLNDLLTRCRESRVAVRAAEGRLAAWNRAREAYEKALADWEQANADKPESERAPKPVEPEGEKPAVPAEVTFESLMKDELGPLASADPAQAAPIRYWKTPELMSREAWEKETDFGEGLKYELTRLKEDGEYNGIPTQLNRRQTKVIVRRLEAKDREPQAYEDVKDKVFERFLERRQMDRAAKELERLRKEADEAIKQAPADDEAQQQEAWETAYKAWSERIGGKALRERTGLFIGNVPPPPVEIDDDTSAEAKPAIERRNFVWRTGYATVRPTGSTKDTVTAKPGTFGRRVLRDPVVDDKGSGSAYLIRVAERVYPTKAEFSPRRYAEQLSRLVFGERTQAEARKRPGERSGTMNKALGRYFDNMDWLSATFELETNSPLEELEEPKR